MERLLSLAAGLSLLVSCAPITPTPSAPVSSSPLVAPSPVASVSPVPPSSSPTTVALLVSVQMLEQCGSEGGCAFYADLRDAEGHLSTEKIALGSNSSSGFPARLPVGVYSLTLRSSLVSDIIVNGAPPAETPDASCKGTFEVAHGQNLITARGVFRADSCEVVVKAS